MDVVQLKALATQIKNETEIGGNTANRIGSTLEKAADLLANAASEDMFGDSERKFEITDDTISNNRILGMDSPLDVDKDGNIETKNFKSSETATKKEVEGEVKTEKERAEKAEKALSDDVAKKPSTEDSEHKFEIVDDTEESNPILQLDSRLSTDKDGNIETKGWKSSESAKKAEVKAEANRAIEREDELEKLIKQGGGGTGGDSSTYTEDTTDGSQFSIGDDTIKKNDIFKIFAGYPYTKNFNGKQIVETLNKLSAITINCIGESVTQGQEGLTSPDADTTSINRYSNYLQELLPNATIRNLGAGGEWTNDICARMGWISTIIKKSFVLKGNGTETLLFDYSNNSTSPDMVDGLNGLPMSGSAQEWDGRTKKTTGYLYGYIDVKLRFVSESDDTGLDYRNKIYISRRKIVDYDINVGEGTLLNYGGSQFNGINILLTGGNGGYGNDVDLYMNLIESALNKNEKTIVLQHYSARDWTQKDIFRKMREPLMKKLGDRYVDLWSYICSRECFDDLGIAPTTDTDISSERKDKGIYSDEYGIANGYLPSSFWRYSYTPNNQKIDFVHLNALGYKAVAIICYKKLLQLNWI